MTIEKPLCTITIAIGKNGVDVHIHGKINRPMMLTTLLTLSKAFFDMLTDKGELHDGQSTGIIRPP